MLNWKKILFPSVWAGVIFVFLCALLLFTSPRPFVRFIDFLEDGVYDFELRHSYQPISKESPLVIVDIDDKSIEKEGRWPWSRKKLAELVNKLYQLGVSVIAFDITFPEKEENVAEEVAREVEKKGGKASSIRQVQPSFDFDAIFATSLKQGINVLGFAFEKEGDSIGVLPKPLLEMKEELAIPKRSSYLGNIRILQQAAGYGAFINSDPDPDGVIRFSPLLLRKGKKIYPSLGLEAARLFLSLKKVALIVGNYRGDPVLEGIQLNERKIPTDPWGQILVPFRGPPFSIAYVSATDVLQGKMNPKTLQKKLVFIGSSATAVGDLVATAISQVYAGVEVHADIASGILDNYLPSRPAWGSGVEMILVVIVGLGFAFFLPGVGPIAATLIWGTSVAAIGLFHWEMWVGARIFLPVMVPLLTIAVLYVLNLVWGYLFEKRRRQKVVSIFGEYVPPEFIQQMLQRGGDFGLEGETKELTVLFADIRQFTTISETMTATELKQLLNRYLTPMTQVIFDHKGTIDKYVGDMIMAFWGAPLSDPEHAKDAVLAGLDMQKTLEGLDKTLASEKKPTIHIGVGINTGLMNVGDMGSKFRRAYTVIGDAVNLASRLEGACKYYHAKVLVGEETWRLTEKFFAYRKLDRLRVKGKTHPIHIYEPLAPIEQCDEKMASLLRLHAEAIDAYFRQDWKRAEELFQHLLPANPPLYQIYLDRLPLFQKQPPGANWDGVFLLESK